MFTKDCMSTHGKKNQRSAMLVVLLLVGVFCSLASASNDAFPRPAKLESDVRFWSRVYTEVTTNQGLIHDNRRLNIVYERLSFSPGMSKKARQKKIKQRKKYYQKILLDLAGPVNKRFITTGHKQVRNLWPPKTKRTEFAQGAKQVRFQLGQSNRFKEGLVRSGRWQSYIKSEFSKLNIPAELASLPHVESSFRSDARSHAGAAGLWQFTRSTGRRFMRIDHVVDERLDPFIASRAAGQLLKGNYQITETWPLALTAYNHGAAGMRRAVEQIGDTDIVKIVREYKGRTFGFASRNFYNAFLAALEIDQHPEKYFDRIERERAVLIREVELPSYYTAQGLEAAFGLKNNVFKSLNPALQSTVWNNNKFVPKGYPLRLPHHVIIEKSGRIIASIPSDEKSKKQKPDVSYKVRRGDSLSKIAKRFKVRVGQLVQANGLASQHRIRAGQVLKLPVPVNSLQGVEGRIAKETVFYRVKKGDLLSVIARKAAVLESDVIALNNLKNKNHLNVGQKLRLREDPVILSLAANEDVLKPSSVVKLVPEKRKLGADPSDYEVAPDDSIEIQSNETLGHLAQWLSLSTQAIRNINHLNKQAVLVVGTRLKLSFLKVDKVTFEKRREAYHVALQKIFFSTNRVTGTRKHTLSKDQLASLQRRYKTPLWLLRQYNPVINFNQVGPNTMIIFPVVTKK